MTFDAAASEGAAREGMERARRAQRVQLWKTQADAWLERGRHPYFTADDLVADIGLPDSGPARNNVVGAWMSAQAKAGRIVFTGRFRKSERVEGHGNLQRIWRTVLDGEGARDSGGASPTSSSRTVGVAAGRPAGFPPAGGGASAPPHSPEVLTPPLPGAGEGTPAADRPLSQHHGALSEGGSMLPPAGVAPLLGGAGVLGHGSIGAGEGSTRPPSESAQQLCMLTPEEDKPHMYRREGRAA